MMVTFISQCQKNSLKKTRRVLDAFADRIGDNTWQTVITEDGLIAVKKMLRQTASKNTAVSCHWIRSRARSELLWVVGNRGQFDEVGRVPVNSTENDKLKPSFESNWHTVEDIKLLAQMAALLHDLGKASVAFQNRLRKKLTEKNIYRHEWVSLRLFLAFVGGDDDESWLRRMISPTEQDDTSWVESGRYWRDGLDNSVPPPFKNLSPLAAAIAWLVVTHHRLPVKPSFNIDGQPFYFGKSTNNLTELDVPELLKTINSDWNEISQQTDIKLIAPYWTFNKKLPFTLPKWRSRLAKLAEKLLNLKSTSGKGEWLNNPYVMHLARLSLMLADHHYSSLLPDANEREQGDKNDLLFANTHKDGTLKQTLTEHLLGVARLSGSVAHCLPEIERGLPRLAGHQGLKKRSESKRFRWQDKAADSAAEIRQLSENNGAFIINMASTGCGKTLANARILYSLSKPEEGMRASFALGLRTLTLQTGRSYRDDLNLTEEELAIMVGGSASRALFEFYEAQAEATGSASTQELIEEDGYVIYEGFLNDHPVLSKVLADQRFQKLLAAPVLVCTIDHLIPATEAQRAGRQIAPMLRLMSSDLVLDELDDFDINDLPALTRLVHWAGLLGSRVVISSATLPPCLVEGMYQAYLSGRQHHHRNRNGTYEQGTSFLNIPCLWVDEFHSNISHCANAEQFVQVHEHFVISRINQIDKSIKRDGAARRGDLLPLSIKAKNRDEIAREFAQPVLDAIVHAHQKNHEICPASGKQISFGLVRMANIEPLFRLAQTLIALDAPDNIHLHICVYHSRFSQIVRSAIEYQLDVTLNRRNSNAVYESTEIRKHIDSHSEQNHIFVVLGSPVTEVGRDHDYDWAIVEPSSMRSLIQLAGRVQRHRQKACETQNIFIFTKNIRHFYNDKSSDGHPNAVFIKPGFEQANTPRDAPFRLVSHNLEKLLLPEEYTVITAKPRILAKQKPWNAKGNLVDLEHSRLADCMLPKPQDATSSERGKKPVGLQINAASNWQFPQALLTWVLPQHQPFRYNTIQEETLVFLADDDEQRLLMHRIHQQGTSGKPTLYTLEESRRHEVQLNCGRGMGIWGQHDLMALLRKLAADQGISLKDCAKKFSAVNVPDSASGWSYHPALGFSVKK